VRRRTIHNAGSDSTAASSYARTTLHDRAWTRQCAWRHDVLGQEDGAGALRSHTLGAFAGGNAPDRSKMRLVADGRMRRGCSRRGTAPDFPTRVLPLPSLTPCPSHTLEVVGTQGDWCTARSAIALLGTRRPWAEPSISYTRSSSGSHRRLCGVRTLGLKGRCMRYT
jgi:hypothetical protein